MAGESGCQKESRSRFEYMISRYLNLGARPHTASMIWHRTLDGSAWEWTATRRPLRWKQFGGGGWAVDPIPSVLVGSPDGRHLLPAIPRKCRPAPRFCIQPRPAVVATSRLGPSPKWRTVVEPRPDYPYFRIARHIFIWKCYFLTLS